MMKRLVLLFCLFIALRTQAQQYYIPYKASYKTAYDGGNCQLFIDDDFDYRWSGGCLNGYYHGDGTIYIYNRTHSFTIPYFKGTLRYGKREGHGILYHEDGSVFEDAYFSNGMLNGSGTIYYSSGGKFIGNFENNLRVGYGEQYDADGSYYKGNWVNNKKHGRGKGVVSNGSSLIFDGYFENDKFVRTAGGLFSYIVSTENAHGELTKSQSAYWQYYIPPYTLGVLTVQNTSQFSNLDLRVYSDEQMSSLVSTGLNYGTKTEIVTLPILNYGRFVYVKIENVGASLTNYRFYPRFVDIVKKAENAVIEAGMEYLLAQGIRWLFGITGNDSYSSSNDRLAGQASNIIVTSLKTTNLGAYSKQFMSNEITSKIKSQFGNSFWSNVFINLTQGVLNDVYKYEY